MRPAPRSISSVAALSALTFLAPAALADEITVWNNQLLDSIRLTSIPPPRASRAMAMTHLAVFDAVNSIDRGYLPYQRYYDGGGPASKEAAAAQSARDVLASLFPTRTADFDAQLTTSLNAIADSPAKTRGVAIGAQAAAAMIASRANDGSNNNVPYTPGTQPGDWHPTPPGFANALLPGWGGVRPFGIQSGSQFRPAAPHSLTSQQYTDAYNEVKTYGSANSTLRTPDQTEIAQIWAAGAGTVTPPGLWNQVAQQAVVSRNLTIDESARLFALLGAGAADAGIAAWDCKYQFNLWRPIEAIRRGAEDGNPDTAPDPAWTPLLVTPPFPAYISGHSTFSAAAASILSNVLGGDAFAFSISADGFTRTYSSLELAAAEAGMSRIYGGIHWQVDNTEGLTCGRAVGAYVSQTLLQVPGPASTSLAVIAAVCFARRRRA